MFFFLMIKIKSHIAFTIQNISKHWNTLVTMEIYCFKETLLNLYKLDNYSQIACNSHSGQLSGLKT